MSPMDELELSLVAIAERSAAIKSACTNEESTKLYLILPVVSALGYDVTDPFEVLPEHQADFKFGSPERVDFVIMHGALPAIAVECKKFGCDLAENRGQLRSYFAALPTVRLGILTNGIQFELFVDSEMPNIMDAEPFVTLDLEVAAQGAIPGDVLQALLSVSKSCFEPQAIAEAAEARLMAKRLRSLLVQEVREPSEELCRLVLQRAGLKNLRRTSIQSRYSSMVRSAFEEALVLPVIHLLRAAQTQESTPAISDGSNSVAGRIRTTDREHSVYNYVCRRLAYLAGDEVQFKAIERVLYRDYIGKFAVYYVNIRKGRLFDFCEGANGFDKFSFPAPYGEIITNSIADIDEPLKATFSLRVKELGSTPLSLQFSAAG